VADDGPVAGGGLADWISLGVLTSFVPRDAVRVGTVAYFASVTGLRARR
jgi:hypothetical protein